MNEVPVQRRYPPLTGTEARAASGVPCQSLVELLEARIGVTEHLQSKAKHQCKNG